MRNQMIYQRESRYAVIKFTDANQALSVSEREQLASLMEKVAAHRIEQGNGLLECVVIEADWPFYEDAWAAIEQMASEGDGVASDMGQNAP